MLLKERVWATLFSCAASMAMTISAARASGLPLSQVTANDGTARVCLELFLSAYGFGGAAGARYAQQQVAATGQADGFRMQQQLRRRAGQRIRSPALRSKRAAVSAR